MDPSPRLPAANLSLRHCPQPLLLWAFRGTGQGRVNTVPFRIHPGQAILVPTGADLTVSTSPSAAVVPLALPASRLAPTVPVSCTIPDDLGERLLYEYAQNLGFLQEDPHRQRFLTQLLHRLSEIVPPGVYPPPAPRSPDLAAVARHITEHPASPINVTILATIGRMSARTLQRRFREETGMTASRWRTHLQVALAARHLAAGRSVEHTAHVLGFSGAGTLSRAFREHTGMSPRQFLNSSATSAPLDDAPTLRLDADLEIPASKAWPRINGSHVLIWAYRGSSRVDFGGKSVELNEHNVLVLPVGTTVATDSPAGSLILPVGHRAPGNAPLTQAALDPPRPLSAGPDFLLSWMVSTYSPLKPPGHRTESVFDYLGYSGNFDADGRAAPFPDKHFAAADTNPRTGGVIRRMTLARIFLERGVPASAVARQLGYAQMSSFTRAFTEAHGISPARHQLLHSTVDPASPAWQKALAPAQPTGCRS